MKLFILALALNTIDYYQTLEIARNPSYYESNQILGKTPSQNSVHKYFLASSVGLAAVQSMKNKKVKKTLLAGFVLNQAFYVSNNHSLGVRVRF